MHHRRNPDARWIRVEDGIVVFVPRPSAFVDLDEAGAALFDLLEVVEWSEPRAATELAVALDMTLDEASESIGRFCVGLFGYGVLTNGGPST